MGIRQSTFCEDVVDFATWCSNGMGLHPPNVLPKERHVFFVRKDGKR